MCKPGSPPPATSRQPSALPRGMRLHALALSRDVRRPCELHQLHLVTYENGLKLQQKLVEMRQRDEVPDQFLLLEHPAVITLGHGGDAKNLLASEDALRSER